MGLTIEPCGTPLRVRWYFHSSGVPGVEQLFYQVQEAAIMDFFAQDGEDLLVRQRAETIRNVAFDNERLAFPQV
jgi:hypothetical protein